MTNSNLAEIREMSITFNTPYADLLPPLADHEAEALYADIEANGLRDPILVDEDFNVLDGHHRLMFVDNPPYKTISGLSEAQKKAFVVRTNFTRRNLSPEKKKEQLDKNKEIAKELKAEGATQEQIGVALGVAQNTVSYWFKAENINIDKGVPTDSKDIFLQLSTQKLSKEAKTEIISKAENGERQEKIAANYGITQQHVSKLLKRHKDQQEKARRQQARGLDGKAFFKFCDCREGLPEIESHSVDLLITDPPYCTDVDGAYADFLDTWLPDAFDKVKDTGRIYICFGPYPEEIAAYMDVAMMSNRFVFGNVLVWTYRNTIGPSTNLKYKNNWQGILYLYGPNAPDLNAAQLKDAFSVFDIAAPDGRHGDRFHTWGKPEKLAEALISHSTQPGDVVLDPFAGSGIFGLTAGVMGRISFNFEKDEAHYLGCLDRGGKAMDKEACYANA